MKPQIWKTAIIIINTVGTLISSILHSKPGLIVVASIGLAFWLILLGLELGMWTINKQKNT